MSQGLALVVESERAHQDAPVGQDTVARTCVNCKPLLPECFPALSHISPAFFHSSDCQSPAAM